MQPQAAARSAAGLLSLVALLVLPSVACAASGHRERIDHALLRSASWHGRAIEHPLPARRSAAGTPPLTRLAAWSAGPVRRGVGFARAAGSRRVREVQRLLDRIGYRPGAVDGRFGPRTEASVIDFQYKHGLARNGVVGSATLLTLRARARAHWPAVWKAGPVRRGSGYSRPSGSARVREVQRRLRKLGFDSGPVDGRFGPLTERAVTRFQGSRRLAPDGVVGLRTLGALGLRARREPQRSRPNPAHPPRVPTVHHGPSRLPLGLIFGCLALIGLITAVASYVRTSARVRRSRRVAFERPDHGGMGVRHRPRPVRRRSARQAIRARSKDDH